jgi:hypothetical protein
MSAYMYIIDSYEAYAASALTFVALVRYVAAGGMTVIPLRTESPEAQQVGSISRLRRDDSIVVAPYQTV